MLLSCWTLLWLALFFVLTFSNLGFGAEFWWFHAAAAFIAICFGFVLTFCSRSHSNRLSFEKGLELARRLDKVEAKFLKGTDMGVRAGPEGAWIEVGFERHLNTFYSKFVERRADGEHPKLESRKDELSLEKTTREVVRDIKGLITQNIASNVRAAQQTVSLGQDRSHGSLFDAMGSFAQGPTAAGLAFAFQEPEAQTFAVQFRDRSAPSPAQPTAGGPSLQMPQNLLPAAHKPAEASGGRFASPVARDSFGQPSTRG